MPTYEYRCGACGHAFERFQSMNDDPVRECPECGQDAAERMISSGAGLIFKGSGFYVTDYKRSSGESGQEAGASDNGGNGGNGGDGGAGSEGAGKGASESDD